MDGFSSIFKNLVRYWPASVVLTLVACGVAGVTSSGKVDETGTVPLPTSNSAVVAGAAVSNSAGFTIAVSSWVNSSSGTNTNISTILHQAPAAFGATQATTNFGVSCQIADGVSGSAGDMLCILEVPELDLYFNSLSLVLNVPTDMCSYVGWKNYTFFNYKSGVGPSVMSFSEDYNKVVSTTYSNIDSTGAPHCKYNYGDTFYYPNGTFKGNCCTGSYVLSESIQADSLSPYVTTVVNGSWGGTPGACLSGPGVNPNSKPTPVTDTTTGLPELILYPTVGTGLNATFTIPQGAQQEVDNTAVISDLEAANFFNPADFTAVDSATGIKMPAAMSTTSYSTTQGIFNYSPQNTYEWDCFDTAQEIQSRIRLFIRKWDTDPITSGGNPNAGFGGVNSGTYPSDPLDDHWAWKDFSAVMPGAEYPGADI